MKIKNNRRIYVSDLDGTLLHDDATLSAYSRKKIIELLDAGVHFTVASARSVVSLWQVLRKMPFRLPVIELNGAFISNFQTGEHLIVNDITKNLTADIYSYILEYNCMPFISTFNGKEDCLYYQAMPNDGMQWYHDNRRISRDRRLRHVPDLKKTFADHVVAFTVINTRQQLKNLANRMMDDFSDRLQMHFFENPYSPPWHWLTIHDKKACKAYAMRELVKYAGLKFEDLTVFGDNLNDINMFKTAPRAIAVQNATEQIKGLATETIGPNTDDSVVKFIIAETMRS